MRLVFTVPGPSGATSLTADVHRFVVAGWTGRDAAAVEHHIHELAAIGVQPPSTFPLFYRVACQQLCQDGVIEAVGEATSGEAEPFLFIHKGETYVSLASDHTDRSLEAHSVALSKQICSKPVARVAWRLAEVQDRWDTLVLRSWIDEGHGWVLYQQGTLASLRTPADLLQRCGETGTLVSDGFAMTCGTVAVRGSIRPAARFRMALCDETRDLEITHEYECRVLPVVG